MELGVVEPGFRERLVEKLRVFFEGRGEVLAAYLFGSAADDGPVVNDIDIMVLLPERDFKRFALTLIRLDADPAEYLGVSSDDIDSIVFDLQHVDPEVLHRAVNEGILVKCSDEEALTDEIERLLLYFLENKPVLRLRKMLRREMLSSNKCFGFTPQNKEKGGIF